MNKIDTSPRAFHALDMPRNVGITIEGIRRQEPGGYALNRKLITHQHNRNTTTIDSGNEGETQRIQPSIKRREVKRVDGEDNMQRSTALNLGRVWVGDLTLPLRVRAEFGQDDGRDDAVRSAPWM